jgi:hypothetical protein
MKYFALLLVFMAVSAFADPLTAKNERDVYDLMWLPHKGISFGSSEIKFEDHEFESNVAGAPGKIQESDRRFLQNFGHSFTDRLSVTVGTNYLFRRKITFTPDSGSETITEDKGVGDPSGEARWRVLEQGNNSFTLDVVPSLSVSTGKFEQGTGLKQGNNQTGRNNYGARLEAGKKYNKFQWMTFVGYTNYMEAKGNDLTSGDSVTSSSFSSYQAGLKIRAPIDDQFFLAGGIRYSKESGHTLANGSGSTKITTPAITHALFEGDLTYITGPKFAFIAGFQLGAITNYTLVDQANNKTQYKDGSITTFSAMARYQF